MTVRPLGAFSGTIILSLQSSNFPQASLSENSVSITTGAAVKVQLTIPVSSTIPPGPYSLTVYGVGPGVTHVIVFLVAVIGPDFRIGVTPSTLNIQQGMSSTTMVRVDGLDGFTSKVGVTTSYDMTHLSVTPVATEVVPLPKGMGSSGSLNLTISIKDNTLPDTYQVVVSGKSGTIFHFANVFVNVSSPNFTLTATSPSAVIIGQLTSSTITLVAKYGFRGIVNLRVSSLPSALACSIVMPDTIVGSGTATVSCLATKVGAYNATITGISEGETHNAYFTVTVNTPSETAPAPNALGETATMLFGITGGAIVTTVIVLAIRRWMLRRSTVGSGSMTRVMLALQKRSRIQ